VWGLITIFALPKAFCGHTGVIQRNAIASWTRLSPRPEIILFGDDAGTSEFAGEFGLRHIALVGRNEKGIPFVGDLFARAQDVASFPILAYVNSDIILFDDFLRAVEAVAAWRPQFLMAGRRWDIDITAPIDFAVADWEARLRADVARRGRRRSVSWIDYFVFPRGMYREVPAFLIGRMWWDNWLVWKAADLGAAVVDATPRVLAVHQNHDYGYAGGYFGVVQSEEGKWNERLAESGKRARTLREARFKFGRLGLRRNFEGAIERCWRAWGEGRKRARAQRDARELPVGVGPKAE
jgi:hypothetical protein